MKEEILADLADDLARDRYVQGAYVTGAAEDDQAFFGCHVGCLMMAYARHENRQSRHPEPLFALARGNEDRASTWHGEVPAKLGMPHDLAQFWDKMFEKMPATLAPRFAVESLECVPVGADLRNVLCALIAWLLTDPVAGFLAGEQGATPAEAKVREYVDVVGAMWQQRADNHTMQAATGIGLAELEVLESDIRDAAHGVPVDCDSRFYYASLALLSAASGSVVHHVALALIDEYTEAISDNAIPLPVFNQFDNPDRPALWAVAEKFFDLCSKAPQGERA